MQFIILINLSMHSQRKKQIQNINQILRQQRKSMSKLKLFDEGAFDQPHISKAVYQSQKSQKHFARKGKKEPNLQNNFSLQTKPSQNQISHQHSQSKYADEDQIYKINLSPVSRLSLKTKNQITSSRLEIKNVSAGEHESSKKSTKKQPSVKAFQAKKIIKPKNQLNLQNIPYEKVQKYVQAHPELLKAGKGPDQVYNLLRPLLDKFKLQITMPLIKQYKNCTYFGEVYEQGSHHQGFLIFQAQKKVYYGPMLNDKKNGKGIEIDFESNIIYKGEFEKGRKKGTFQVIKKHEKYVGNLVNDQYSGVGKLFNDVSIYNGYFQQGLRHGQGQQFFPQSGLKISGTFIHNQFTNNQTKLQNSRLQTKGYSLPKPNYKKKIAQAKENPEQSFKTSRVQKSRYNYQDYNFDLGGRQLTIFKQTDGEARKKKAGYIFKRKRSIQQEQPLPRITQCSQTK